MRSDFGGKTPWRVSGHSDGDMAAKTWCFTIFFSENSENERDQWISDRANVCTGELVSRAIFGRELCPQSGRLHVQGAITFRNPWRFDRVKTWLGNNAHVEKSRSVNAAFTYCKKDGNFFEVDNRRKSNDKHGAFIEMIADGKDDEELMDEFPGMYLRYRQSIDSIREVKRPKTREPPVCVWIHGATGVGKTRWVHDTFGEEVDCIDYHHGFFHGIGSGRVALIDDWRFGWCPFPLLLRLLDRYPLTVNIKGGSKRWLYQIIILTSPQAPTWVDWGSEDGQQVTRRLTHTWLFPDQIDEASRAFRPPGQEDQPADGAVLDPPADATFGGADNGGGAEVDVGGLTHLDFDLDNFLNQWNAQQNG